MEKKLQHLKNKSFIVKAHKDALYDRLMLAYDQKQSAKSFNWVKFFKFVPYTLFATALLAAVFFFTNLPAKNDYQMNPSKVLAEIKAANPVNPDNKQYLYAKLDLSKDLPYDPDGVHIQYAIDLKDEDGRFATKVIAFDDYNPDWAPPNTGDTRFFDELKYDIDALLKRADQFTDANYVGMTLTEYIFKFNDKDESGAKYTYSLFFDKENFKLVIIHVDVESPYVKNSISVYEIGVQEYYYSDVTPPETEF